MAVSYNKLWKLLIDKGLKRSQLYSMAGVSTNAIAKMGKNEDVRLEVLAKICTCLGCTLNDIVEIVPDEK
ncbi:MAG TPA: helix-turn-helix transcriptional regulator [Candidatus Ornithospirochaeta avicola]|uniref:Helix-turn-helix transcriptional regulator n=1 Tax=Candidatus Ornithospirochaeta avicola TaxID=2840896 RepID=A0A9D1TMK2_9SPIO|nr:helix-turn-helix transcriptional regulator [Candidatus Ornithospirochaeta avicola]